jgi:hypothetical protein
MSAARPERIFSWSSMIATLMGGGEGMSLQTILY